MAIRIRRREFIVTLGGAVATCPLIARAQQTVRVLRVGFVGGQPPDAAIYVAFRKRMAELGYRDRYFVFEYIQTPSIDAYDASFRELAARKPDIVIAAGNEPALRAARAAVGTLPIVFLAIDFDPVERGYVASLARPGGNITGIFVHPLELAAKRQHVELMQRFAKEFVGLQPDLILTSSTPATAAMLQQTRTIPIIFVWVADPVGSGFVASLPRPGGNVTGFTPIEGSLGGKWVELLKEIASRVARVHLAVQPGNGDICRS